VSAYKREVGERHIVDWIYNRPRPQDDRIPSQLSKHLGIARADMEKYPYDLVHIGGNFMTDGRGLALSTQLLLDENGGMSRFATNFKKPETVWEILKDQLGIYQYLPLPKLPFDPIHHLDMHLKLLNEETILLGEYPAGVADGEQIEANLAFLLKNFPTPSGQPWKVIRIPMPADGGFYPDSPGAWYQTYTNSVFVNKMLLVPQYNCPQDSIALEILEKALPGYKVIGIDARGLIRSAGALHCVTSNIGAAQPLLIQHSPQQDLPFAKRDIYIEAKILHESGIKSAYVFYQLDEKGPFQRIPMMASSKDPSAYFAYLPKQMTGSKIRYYFQAEAHSGKEMLRPMPAPEAYFEFQILEKKRNLPR
ncbi:MAG: agmatine deiminase family protein, partial [Bacteroidota bacterium]